MRELVLSLDDEPAKLADKTTAERLKSLARAMGGVASLAFSPDGSLLAMCGGSFGDVPLGFENVRGLSRNVTGPNRLKVWDVKTGTLKHDLIGHSHAHAVAFSPDGNVLACAGSWDNGRENGTGVILWNPQTGSKNREFTTDANGGTRSIAFSPNSKLMAISSRTFDKDTSTGTSAICLFQTGTGIPEWKQSLPGWGQPVAFLLGGSRIAVLSGGRSIQFLEPTTGALRDEIATADFVPANLRQGNAWSAFANMSQGSRFAIGGVDKEGKGCVEIWDFDEFGAAANHRQNAESPLGQRDDSADATQPKVVPLPSGDTKKDAQ